MPRVSLRAIGSSDDDLLDRVFREANPALVAALPPGPAREALLAQQVRAWRSAWAGAEVSVVCEDDEPLGVFVRREEADRVHLVELDLRTGARGRGVGSEVLRQVLAELADRGVPATLHVAVGNRARRLYERLGFRVQAGGSATHAVMAWTPPSPDG